MRMGIMWKNTLLLLCLSSWCLAGPLHGVKRNTPIVLREEDTEAEPPAPEPIAPEYPDMPSTLTLPSNATSIRNDITDNFSCEDKVYGYYADVENDCQIFHVCLPVTYADGKENTFRWSFICPEETAFSQDSFTCMRRGDMAITCEESVNYYELNRNFGMTEEQNAISNNVRPSEELAETQVAPAEPTPQAVQQPVAAQEEPQAAPPAVLPQSMPVKEKPVKVQKPNRRKPQPKPQQHQTIYPTNKLPSTMPLRKMPNMGSKMPVSVPLSVPAEVIPIQKIEAEATPVLPHYKKRPAVTNHSEKEFAGAAAGPFKVDVVHTLSNPESFKRKRPTFANKPNVVAIQVSENVPFIEGVSEVLPGETAVPAVKFESNLGAVPLPAKEESTTINEPVAQTAEETPVVVEPLKVAVDTEPQASETDELVVEPENTIKTIITQQTVPENEAAPVAAEETEYTAPVVEETAESEVAPLVEEVPKIEDPVVEAQKNEEPATPIDTIKEIPAVVSEPFYIAPEEEKLSEPTIPQISVEAPKYPEHSTDADHQVPGPSEPVALDAIPEVIAAIGSAEESLPSLEELEEQKPANAAETMPATPEMEQQDLLVQQAFAEKDNHLQTVGGFKPVDPEMAAEAEAIISDFINTLKSGNPNMTPNLSLEEELPNTSAEREGTEDAIKESQQTADTNKETESKPADTQIAQEAETNSMNSVAAVEPVAVAAENIPIVAETEPNAEEEDVKVSQLLKFPISNSFPADMYHIPVTVIHTPYEEVQNFPAEEQEPQQSNVEYVKAEEPQVEEEALPQEQKKDDVKLLSAGTETVEDTKVDVGPAVVAQPAAVEANEGQIHAEELAVFDNANTQPETAEPEAMESESEAAQPLAPVAFRPISIDDIVELVKERLDQVPANEKGAPMELVMEPGNADKPAELKVSLEKGSTPQAVSAEQTPSEDIIFPIYHRLSGVESNDLKGQETVNEPSESVQTATKTELQMLNEGVETSAEDVVANVANTVKNIETETKAENVSAAMAADAPAAIQTAEVAKTNRALRSRSLTNAKLDPRKRRFLFRADAS